MSNDVEFARGFNFFEPRQNAPDFVLGTIGVHVVDAIRWLQAQEPNERGYITLKVNRSKATQKPYVALDDFKPTPKERNGYAESKGRAYSTPALDAMDDDVSDIPF